mmetsp:Transcript_17777/g.25312  ORF Transcript_17777/g.25312 Transcript_17777/m.25312 type:complete len:139 (-) Transcript_17777:686-1102(-)
MLLNIFVPIVWDAYTNIQNKKSTNVLFWEIRLEFAIQAMLISSQDIKMASLWCCVAEIFEDKTQDQYFGTCVKRSILLPFFRIKVALIMVLWLTIGLFAAGTLWPPQVKENVWAKWKSARAYLSWVRGCRHFGRFLPK